MVILKSTIQPEVADEDISDIQDILKAIHSKSIRNITIIAAYFFSNAFDRDEAIQDFYAGKLCNLSRRKLIDMDAKGVGYIIRAFRNHCIDTIRKRNRLRTQAVSELEEQIPDIDSEGINERIESATDLFMSRLAGKFSDLYVKILEMMIDGQGPEKIAESLNVTKNYVYVAKCRIRDFLSDHGKSIPE